MRAWDEDRAEVLESSPAPGAACQSFESAEQKVNEAAVTKIRTGTDEHAIGKDIDFKCIFVVGTPLLMQSSNHLSSDPARIAPACSSVRGISRQIQRALPSALHWSYLQSGAQKGL